MDHTHPTRNQISSAEFRIPNLSNWTSTFDIRHSEFGNCNYSTMGLARRGTCAHLIPADEPQAGQEKEDAAQDIGGAAVGDEVAHVRHLAAVRPMVCVPTSQDRSKRAQT